MFKKEKEMTEPTNEMPLRMRLAAMAPVIPTKVKPEYVATVFNIPYPKDHDENLWAEFWLKIDVARRYLWADAMIEANKKD